MMGGSFVKYLCTDYYRLSLWHFGLNSAQRFRMCVFAFYKSGADLLFIVLCAYPSQLARDGRTGARERELLPSSYGSV